MLYWHGSKLGSGLWQVYNDTLRNIPIRINHNLDLPESRQIFNVRFRNKFTGKEIFLGNNYFFTGELGPKFYVTELTNVSCVIEIRPKLDDDQYEYLIEIFEEAPDPALTVTTGGSVDSQGFGISYRFDFGDKTVTPWSSSISASHVYMTPGTYQVKSQASAPGLDSFWSNPLIVKVLDEDVVVPTPGLLEGDGLVQLGIMSSYKITGSPVTDGSVEYRVDWGDGTLSDWTPYNIFSHTWKSEGTYKIKVQSKVVDGYQKVSRWSEDLIVQVKSQYYFIQELASAQIVIDSTLKKSPIPTGLSLIIKESSVTFTVPFPSTVTSDVFQYKLNYGNGVITNYQSSSTFSYRFYYSGTYKITAKVRKSVVVDGLSQWEEFEWSESLSVTVKDRVVTTPFTPIPDHNIFEIKSKELGDVTTNPDGRYFLLGSNKKWISDYLPCERLGKVFISHNLKEVPYLIWIEFDLEGDKEVRVGEKSYSVVSDGSPIDVSTNIKLQYGHQIPVSIHKYIKSIIPNPTGNDREQIVSRFRILVRC